MASYKQQKSPIPVLCAKQRLLEKNNTQTSRFTRGHEDARPSSRNADVSAQEIAKSLSASRQRRYGSAGRRTGACVYMENDLGTEVAKAVRSQSKPADDLRAHATGQSAIREPVVAGNARENVSTHVIKTIDAIRTWKSLRDGVTTLRWRISTVALPVSHDSRVPVISDVLLLTERHCLVSQTVVSAALSRNFQERDLPCGRHPVLFETTIPGRNTSRTRYRNRLIPFNI